jgi:NAD(P)-dependent dehydrogenase (short-subunit alcohol dehydrogenase family)
MAGRLQDRVALVTGAGSIGPGWGNGKATAVLFAREGARIFAVDVNLEAVEETRKIIGEEGGACATHRADVAKADSVQAMVDACMAAFGRVDVLVNNVGIARTGSIVTTEEADWDLVTDVNLKSVYLTCRQVVPIMERQGKGAIVNIASIAAHRWTGISYASYYATKGAIVSLSRSIALEWAAKGIRCNSVSPGLMNTPMIHHGLTGATAPRATPRTWSGCAMRSARWAIWARAGTRRMPACSLPPTRRSTSPRTTWWSTAASRRSFRERYPLPGKILLPE